MIWTLQSMFGQFFDATVGQMVNALSGPRPGNRSSPWQNTPPPTRPSLPPAPRGGYPGESQGGTSGSPSAAPWQPAAGNATVVVVRGQESRTPSPKDLDDDAIKLVKYGLVSIRRCHEKVLWGGVILVTTPMNSTSFASWIVAQYLQSPEYLAAVALDRGNEIAPADKKYLRVAWAVLTRWPREPKSGCGEGKLNALRGIRNALLGLSQAPLERSATTSSARVLALPEPAAEAAGAPPEEPNAYETAPPPEPAAPAEAAPATVGETLSTAGEIPAQTSETALAPVESAPLTRPRRQRQPPPPETPTEPQRPGRRPKPGEPRRRPR
jgi:hypothetical protein